jgi:hypothetical protein
MSFPDARLSAFDTPFVRNDATICRSGAIFLLGIFDYADK